MQSTRRCLRFVNARHVASFILFFLAISICPSAIARDTKLQNIPQSIVNLDLCTLAYQLYHQSLCLPLDPWYDNLSRIGSDRRNNICRFTHEYAATLGRPAAASIAATGFYSGPNAARGWSDSNLNLDPVLTNYKQLDVKLPAFTRDGERFIAVQAPTYATENIKEIEVVRYKGKPASFPCTDVEEVRIREYPGGDDHLIAFEGGTGIAGNTSPAWSIMGFVLMQKTPTGYDAHIVFRGSRSGSALSKTIWKAQDFIGAPKGNPDWITDLRSGKQVEKPLVSKVGKVTEGFAEALPTMLGPITACCQILEQKYPAPEHIYVTGHSLGAGLASQFVSAATQGSFGDQLRRDVKSWSWDKMCLIAFAQPIPGDPTFAANFDKISPNSMHYWVAGDDVVEATSGRIVGMLIDQGEHVGVQKKLNLVADCNDNPHEVFVIRAGLLKESDAELQQQLCQENTWGYYDSLAKMLAGQSSSYVYPGAREAKIVTSQNLQKVLQNYNFSSEFDRWLEQVYAKMIADKDSYIGFKFQSTLDARRALVLDIVAWIRKQSSNDNALELDRLVDEYKLITGNLGLTNEEQWIYGGMILSRIQNTSLTVDELLSKPEIKTCIEANVVTD